MKEDIWYRATWPIRGYDLHLKPGEIIVAHVPGTPVVAVEVRQSEAEASLTAIATMQGKTTSEKLERLDIVASGGWPPGSAVRQSVFDDEPPGTDGWPTRAPYREELPQDLRDLLFNARERLQTAARSVMRTLRWRYEVHGPPISFGGDAVEASRDGVQWLRLGWGSATLSVSSVPQFSAQMGSEVGRLLDGEPFAHDLFREAEALAGANPRAALVLAVAALETGFKSLVAALVPNAEWLVENAPSPPIERLLREYLPLLPVKHRFDGIFLRLKEETLVKIREAVHRRNRLVHHGAPVEPEFLRSRLDLVGNLLWFFDYYAGHEWARWHIHDADLFEPC
jgi:hypothetical protein